MTLKDLREQAGYTQAQAAGELQIMRTSYARYESGERVPDLKMVGKIAELFHVSLDVLCNALRGVN